MQVQSANGRPPAGDGAAAAIPLTTFPCFDGSGAQVALTSRVGGVSTGRYASLNLGFNSGDEPEQVVHNRELVAAGLGVQLDELVFCRQVHDRAVTVVTAADRGRGARSLADAIPATDAMVTTETGPVLAILVADCVPIVLLDPAARVLATVHAGWRGTVKGVTPAAVEAMSALGARPERMVALIGPRIGADRYEVGEEVAAAVTESFGALAPALLRPNRPDHYLLDLGRAASLHLRSAGLQPEHIHDSGLATGPETPYYSHRLEQPTGRFAICARLLEDAA